MGKVTSSVVPYPEAIYRQVYLTQHWGMDSLMQRFEHRRQRLIELLQAVEYEKRYWFAAAIGQNDTYLSRLLYEPHRKGRKNLGDQLVAAISEKFRLPPGWFDMPPRSLIPKGIKVVDKDGNVEIPFQVSEPMDLDSEMADYFRVFSRLPINQREAAVEMLRTTIKMLGADAPEPTKSSKRRKPQ